jgi:hypothetical protein
MQAHAHFGRARWLSIFPNSWLPRLVRDRGMACSPCFSIGDFVTSIWGCFRDSSYTMIGRIPRILLSRRAFVLGHHTYSSHCRVVPYPAFRIDARPMMRLNRDGCRRAKGDALCGDRLDWSYFTNRRGDRPLVFKMTYIAAPFYPVLPRWIKYGEFPSLHGISSCTHLIFISLLYQVPLAKRTRVQNFLLMCT